MVTKRRSLYKCSQRRDNMAGMKARNTDREIETERRSQRERERGGEGEREGGRGKMREMDDTG